MAERSRLQSNLNDCVNSIKQNVQTFQVKIKLSVDRLQEEAVYSFQRLKEQVSDQLLGHATPVFAVSFIWFVCCFSVFIFIQIIYTNNWVYWPAAQSIAGKATAAAGSFNRPTLPVFDLSFNPEELKFRLQAVPVYTVVNNRNEFVLVSGEVRVTLRFHAFNFGCYVAFLFVSHSILCQGNKRTASRRTTHILSLLPYLAGPQAAVGSIVLSSWGRRSNGWNGVKFVFCLWTSMIFFTSQ